MGAETCRTQEELPAEPESGSEGSSTVESTSVTRKRSDAGLLCISLMHDLNNVLGRAAKTGRRPVITIRGAPGRSPSNGCLAGTGGMPSWSPLFQHCVSKRAMICQGCCGSDAELIEFRMCTTTAPTGSVSLSKVA